MTTEETKKVPQQSRESQYCSIRKQVLSVSLALMWTWPSWRCLTRKRSDFSVWSWVKESVSCCSSQQSLWGNLWAWVVHFCSPSETGNLSERAGLSSVSLPPNIQSLLQPVIIHVPSLLILLCRTLNNTLTVLSWDSCRLKTTDAFIATLSLVWCGSFMVFLRLKHLSMSMVLTSACLTCSCLYLFNNIRLFNINAIL